MPGNLMHDVLARYGAMTLAGINRFVPDKEPRAYLYDLVKDYPSRGGKGFRPALCLATSKAYGGSAAFTLNSAITLELLHNAFLIHDDVEDESFFRRTRPTMHEASSKSIAVNVGDAMNALALEPVLQNRDVLGPRLTLDIVREVQHMALESVEGQAMELGWRKDNLCTLQAEDYFRMILKKTCWYTCTHPIRIGALIGTHGRVDASTFDRLGYFMGVAFQIQDDVLNLIGDEEKYGKEICGDIIEGKRTLMLIDLMQKSSEEELTMLRGFLGKPIADRTRDEADSIFRNMERYGCIAYAIETAKYMAGAALKEFYTIFSVLPDSEDKQFIESIILYMISRDY